MPKCSCGDIAYRPDPIEGRKQAWRCGGCHRTLGRCSCATPAPLDDGGRGACHPCSRHDHLRCVLDRPCPCRDTVHDCGVVDCEPTGRRLFDLKDDADHDWLADYFAGYHGVPMHLNDKKALVARCGVLQTKVTAHHRHDHVTAKTCEVCPSAP